MDVVRLTGAGAVAACAMLALLASTRAGRAEPPSFGTQIETFDAGVRAGEQRPAFSLFGPALAEPSTVPSNDSASLFPRARIYPKPISAWDGLIDEASRRFGIPRDWVRGVMHQESGGRTSFNGRPITSSAGAMGLMQVMPATFAELTARYGLGSDPYEPRANILAGAAYLREMYDRFGPAHFLAAYNAGPGRVDEHLRSGRPLPNETQRYVQALVPQLVGSSVNNASATSSGVRDLTSAEAMRDAALLPSRRPRTAPSSSAPASVFVTANGSSSTRDRQSRSQSDEGLFVRLTHQDQRRQVIAGDGPQD